ncbi:hypothetical protein ABZU32_28945 [Sphaerisporangium sp. NPDC005288]|uniref:hypothetical protein n=1 Tax=Sphaerisporangium sp. NPDC005288 TaxID=3155114 RepID=UPI0033AC6101
MGQFLAQLPALLGVVVGALATLATTRATDRARWKREMEMRWDAQRLEAYMEYGARLKDLSTLAFRATAGKRPGSRNKLIDPALADQLYAEAEANRTRSWERVLLMGDAATVDAARRWRVTIARLHDYAQGVTDDWDGWEPAVRRVDDARDAYYQAARHSLRVGGGDVAQSAFLRKMDELRKGRETPILGE